MPAPASAIPVYFDLARMGALCSDLDEAPPATPRPFAGWEHFCSWAAGQADPGLWRERLVSFVRWQGARDGALLRALLPRRPAGSLHRAWLAALSRPEGALFAGWVDMRAGSSEASSYADTQGRRSGYVALTDAERTYTAVRGGSGLLREQAAARGRLALLSEALPSPVLLVARIDRSRTLIPAFAGVGCS